MSKLKKKVEKRQNCEKIPKNTKWTNIENMKQKIDEIE